MSEADRMTTTKARAVRRAPSRDERQALAEELAGAAYTAAALFALLREGDDVAEHIGFQAAAEWVEDKLSAAAENMLAVEWGLPPRWSTTAPQDAIRLALEECTAPAGAEHVVGSVASGELAGGMEAELFALLRALPIDRQEDALAALRGLALSPERGMSREPLR